MAEFSLYLMNLKYNAHIQDLLYSAINGVP